MKLQYKLLVTLTALALTTSLSGCTDSGDLPSEDETVLTPKEASNDDVNINPTNTVGTTPDYDYTVRFDKTTGHIVEVVNDEVDMQLYVDPTLDTMEEANLLSLSLDRDPFFAPTSAPAYATLGTSDELSFTTYTTVMTQIDGKPYPRSTSLGGTVQFKSFKDVVLYYNTYVASPELVEHPSPYNAGLIGGRVYDHVSTAAQKAAQSIGFTAEILELQGNDAVAANQANGVPAWKTYKEVVLNGYMPPENNSPLPPKDPQSDSVTIYAYSYMCATYDVFVTDPAQSIEQMNNLLDDAITVTQITSSIEPVLTETVAPCDVISVSREK